MTVEAKLLVSSDDANNVLYVNWSVDSEIIS
jgi:hypothetical protein